MQFVWLFQFIAPSNAEVTYLGEGGTGKNGGVAPVSYCNIVPVRLPGIFGRRDTHPTGTAAMHSPKICLN